MTHGSTFLSAVSGAPWEDAAPLARVLEVTLAPEPSTLNPAQARSLWKELSYLGSNDLAYLLRGLKGVDYPEIVRDVGKLLSVAGLQPGDAERVVELNEQLVLAKIFADAWQPLDADQRREQLRELNLDDAHLDLTGAAVAAAVLDGRAGPFAVYKLSRIVANSASSVLPARGLAHARRKVAQAVVLVASLRQAQRTALAETALASAEAPSEPPARTVQREERKPATREKVARPRALEQPKKKGAQPARAAKKQRSAKKSAAKKTAAKKSAPKKKATAKTITKKKATAKKITKTASGASKAPTRKTSTRKRG